MASQNGLVDPVKVVKKGVYNKTLKAVNAIRVKLGTKPLKRMPKGIPGQGISCPIYYALEGFTEEVSGDDVALHVEVANPFNGNETFEGHPSDLGVDTEIFNEFISQFDAYEDPAEVAKEKKRQEQLEKDFSMAYEDGKQGRAAYKRYYGYARGW